MDNPFKNILMNEKVPDILRDKVVNDIDVIKLSLEIADLFTVKYPSVIREFFDEDINSNTQKNKKK